jgi:hypothetical protein
MFGVWSSSAKTKVDGAEIACEINSAARLGVLADFERTTKGSRALMARACSMIGDDWGWRRRWEGSCLKVFAHLAPNGQLFD